MSPISWSVRLNDDVVRVFCVSLVCWRRSRLAYEIAAPFVTRDDDE